ncbi:ABC transporter ATP-binding protein [Nakamurella sp. YIM 132084]|uniref:ABC transporter ATP-binding protein n=1 Tax=Nakamurella leprariae TaxID=2803911 RepID=A0A939BXQ5_9ACTN|nr:ABC transporter ATP-binding protein [Nakamurella leprariae]
MLRIRGLTVQYRTRRGPVPAIQDVDLDIAAGETVALVGESGSGKTTTALAVTGLLATTAEITAGSIHWQGQDLLALGRRARRAVSGIGIGLVPQDPTVSLNPVKRIGDQVAEVLLIHKVARKAEAREIAVEALRSAGIDHPEVRARQFPHELSGGMRQRVLIAIALVGRPALLVADEPTSALDVTVQRQILDSISDLITEHHTGMLLVTHDLGVAADRADRVVVMTGGRIVEQGPTGQILSRPEHPYTRSLLEAAPSLRTSGIGSIRRRVGSSTTAPILHAEHLVKSFPAPGVGHHGIRAVDDVSFALHPGRTLGLVGESGSGKSTSARLALRLVEPTGGTVRFDGQDITGLSAGRLRVVRRRFQLVQQNPYASLNPRWSVAQLIGEPLRSYGESATVARERAVELLDLVGLPTDFEHRRPAELSGGQRQRIAIARALALRPDVVVLDEPVSALDVRVQAQILQLLVDLQDELGVAYLFISHDLAVIRQISDDVAVLRGGRVVETGSTEAVFTDPHHAYTRTLLEAIPGRGRV